MLFIWMFTRKYRSYIAKDISYPNTLLKLNFFYNKTN